LWDLKKVALNSAMGGFNFNSLTTSSNGCYCANSNLLFLLDFVFIPQSEAHQLQPPKLSSLKTMTTFKDWTLKDIFEQCGYATFFAM